MSEQITHIAVADDVRLLALVSPRICDALKTTMREEVDALRLGAVTRSSEEFAGPMVAALRERQDAPADGDARKLAFCLGTMAHRAADRMMKPIFTSQAADGAYTRKDISICQDVFLLQRVYGRASREPFSPDSAAPDGALPGIGSAEGLFRLLFQRAMLAAHTFKPDLADAETWLDALFGKLQDFTIDLGRYHRLLTEPDERLTRRAIENVNFYDESNGIIALLRELRVGASVGAAECLCRMHLGDRDSLYARMVSAGYGYVQTASEFWQGRCSRELFFDGIKR